LLNQYNILSLSSQFDRVLLAYLNVSKGKNEEDRFVTLIEQDIKRPVLLQDMIPEIQRIGLGTVDKSSRRFFSVIALPKGTILRRKGRRKEDMFIDGMRKNIPSTYQNLIAIFGKLTGEKVNARFKDCG